MAQALQAPQAGGANMEQQSGPLNPCAMASRNCQPQLLAAAARPTLSPPPSAVPASHLADAAALGVAVLVE